jgi:hypothetical protein
MTGGLLAVMQHNGNHHMIRVTCSALHTVFVADLPR